MARVKGHTIRWFARLDDEWIPRNPYMPGKHWGWDARCSCGWETRTGGAIQERIREAIDEHKWDVLNGFWKEGS